MHLSRDTPTSPPSYSVLVQLSFEHTSTQTIAVVQIAEYALSYPSRTTKELSTRCRKPYLVPETRSQNDPDTDNDNNEKDEVNADAYKIVSAFT